ncbi:ATP-dependent helicase: putative-like protein, partial [Leptotrombidium deliense]
MQSVNNSVLLTSKIKARLCTSKSSLKDDVEAVSESVHVIIGTVGRIYDLISIGSISLRDVKLCFILDWESFDSNEVKDILSLFPDTVQRTIICCDISNVPKSLKGLKLKLSETKLSEHEAFRESVSVIEKADEQQKLDLAIDVLEETKPCLRECSCIPMASIVEHRSVKAQLLENEESVESMKNELSVNEEANLVESQAEIIDLRKNSCEETNAIIAELISISNPEISVDSSGNANHAHTVFSNERDNSNTAVEQVLPINEDINQDCQPDEDMLRMGCVSPIVKNILQEILDIMQMNDDKVNETQDERIQVPEKQEAMHFENIISSEQTEKQVSSTSTSVSPVPKRKKKKTKSKSKPLETLNFSSIKMYYVKVDKINSKFDTLQWLLKTLSVKNAVIYCNEETGIILESIFYKLGNKVLPMYGPISYKEVNNVIKVYMKTEECILIASDKFTEKMVRKPEALTINFDFPHNERVFLK